MAVERKERQPQEIIIPVAIVTRKNKILVFTPQEKLKYESERYYLPKGRQHLGEETINDLVNALSYEYNLKVKPGKKLADFPHTDGRIVEFANRLSFQVFRCKYLEGPEEISSERWRGGFKSVEELSTLNFDDISSLAWEKAKYKFSKFQNFINFLN